MHTRVLKLTFHHIINLSDPLKLSAVLALPFHPKNCCKNKLHIHERAKTIAQIQLSISFKTSNKTITSFARRVLEFAIGIRVWTHQVLCSHSFSNPWPALAPYEKAGQKPRDSVFLGRCNQHRPSNEYWQSPKTGAW